MCIETFPNKTFRELYFTLKKSSPEIRISNQLGISFSSLLLNPETGEMFVRNFISFHGVVEGVSSFLSEEFCFQDILKESTILVTMQLKLLR